MFQIKVNKVTIENKRFTIEETVDLQTLDSEICRTFLPKSFIRDYVPTLLRVHLHIVLLKAHINCLKSIMYD